MAKKKKEEEKRIKELEDRIKKLEEEKKEISEKESKSSLIGSVLGTFLGLGKLVGTLEKQSPEFRERLEKAEKEMSFRMKEGWSIKPRIEYRFSTRPLISGEVSKRREEEIKSVVVWEETPPVEKEELKVYTLGKKLIIETKDGKYRKEIPLSCYVKDLEFVYNKGKENGTLIVNLKKG